MGDINAQMGIIYRESMNIVGHVLAGRLEEGDLQRFPLNGVTFPRNRSCLDHVLLYGMFQI